MPTPPGRCPRHACLMTPLCPACVAGLEVVARLKMSMPPRRRLRPDIVCGTLTSYRYGCRCEPCREANSTYKRAWEQRAKVRWAGEARG